MKLLDKHIWHDGQTWDLIKRMGSGAIFRQCRPFTELECYFVVVIPNIDNHDFMGRKTEMFETLVGAEAYKFKSLEAADAKLHSLFSLGKI